MTQSWREGFDQLRRAEFELLKESEPFLIYEAGFVAGMMKAAEIEDSHHQKPSQSVRTDPK